MKKLAEDLLSLNKGEATTASEDDIKTAKQAAIRAALGEENLDLDNLNDEQLDQLLGKTGTMEEKVYDIVDSMELLEASEFDIQEALRVNLGIKLEEATDILKDVRLNG